MNQPLDVNMKDLDQVSKLISGHAFAELTPDRKLQIFDVTVKAQINHNLALLVENAGEAIEHLDNIDTRLSNIADWFNGSDEFRRF